MSYPRLDKACDHVLKKVAQEIAYEYGLDYVGTEHILLALLRESDGVASTVLKKLKVDEARARRMVDEVLERQMEDTWVFGRLPGSPHYRNVVALAIDEATQLESKQIGTEHLLLGLLREEGSTAQVVLNKLGVSLEKCRAEVLRALAEPRSP